MKSFTSKTTDLQALVTKVIKGASNSKFNTLTSLINVGVVGNTVRMTTTDSNNYFTVSGTVNATDDMSFTVLVDKFSKLIMKMTTENITIKVTDDVISVTGNGTYKIPIQLDVDGTPIRYPKHEINTPDDSGTLKTAVIKSILIHNKPSLAVTMNIPCLTGYLCDSEGVFSGDNFNLCINKVKTFNKPLLVPPIVFDLLSMCPEEEISYKTFGKTAIFETPTIKLYAVMMDGIEVYPKDTLLEIADIQYPSTCTIPKTTILSIVDRLCLFIDDDDEFGMFFTFTKDGIKVESEKQSGIESVSYQGSTNFKDFTCFVNIDSFKKQFNARTEESVVLSYGSDNSFAIKDSTIVQVISLLDDPRATDDDIESDTEEVDTESNTNDDIPF